MSKTKRKYVPVSKPTGKSQRNVVSEALLTIGDTLRHVTMRDGEREALEEVERELRMAMATQEAIYIAVGYVAHLPLGDEKGQGILRLAHNLMGGRMTLADFREQVKEYKPDETGLPPSRPETVDAKIARKRATR